MPKPITKKELLSRLFLISGPCVIESPQLLDRVGKKLSELSKKLKIRIIFKASYDKANRTSSKSFRGPGLKKGIDLLLEIREKYDLSVISDVHTSEEAEYAGKYLDMIQIPAFLCRQSDLIQSACESGCWVNIKKGQFLAPWDMTQVVAKAKSFGTQKIILTERGNSFGYNMLVSDMRSIDILKKMGVPVVFDGTHSVQMPGGGGDVSSGDRQYVPVLSRAAVAAGAHGLFWETHPNPDKALSDGPNMLKLADVEKQIKKCLEIYKVVK